MIPELDKSRPDLPTALLPRECGRDLEYDLNYIWETLLDEYFDPKYVDYDHLKASAYVKGCRGIMCRKAIRESRKRRADHMLSEFAPRIERAYDRVLDYYYVILKYRFIDWQTDLRHGPLEKVG